MKALVYADLHATSGHEASRLSPGQPLQLCRVRAFYDNLLRIYKQYRCEALWDLGDLTDDRSSLPVSALATVCDCLDRFPESNNSIKLVGNHEQFTRNTKIHTGALYRRWFNVVDSTATFEVYGGTHLVCFAYPANTEDLAKWLEAERKQAVGKPTIILGHVQIVGSYSGAGQIMEGLEKKHVSWAKLGLLGHVHRAQEVAPNCYYVGSPFQQNWGEAGEGKRVGIVDVSACTVEWVPLEGYPEYREVGLGEFTQLNAQTEDRFRVVLRSPEEATKFYTLDHAHLAEPVYEFTAPASTETKEAPAWSLETSMERYLAKTPPVGIPLGREDMLEFGRLIASADQA